MTIKTHIAVVVTLLFFKTNVVRCQPLKNDTLDYYIDLSTANDEGSKEFMDYLNYYGDEVPFLEHEARIVGGEYAESETSFYAQIVTDGTSPNCGGALLTLRHVASTAFCTGGGATQFTVYIGNKLKQSCASEPDIIVRTTTTRIVHENYRVIFNNLYNIALLVLSPPVPKTELSRPIAVPHIFRTYLDVDAITGDLADVFGFGVTSPGGAVPSACTPLQKARMPIISNKRCDALVGIVVSDPHLCIMRAEDPFTGACVGDSGDPIVRYMKFKTDTKRGREKTVLVPVLVGISSVVNAACNSGPTIGTRITSVMDFLTDHIPDLLNHHMTCHS